MADNKSINDSTGTPFTVRTDQIGGVDDQVVKAAWGADGVENLVDDVDGKRLPMTGYVGGFTANPSASITRPNNTTAYAALDIIANNTTAGSVSYGALTAARTSAGSFRVDRLRLTTTSANVDSLAVKVRLWSGAAPAYSNGDNGAYAATLSTTASYLGAYTGVWEAFADRAVAILPPQYGGACVKLASGQSLFWDIQTLDGFTPSAQATFALVAEVTQD